MSNRLILGAAMMLLSMSAMANAQALKTKKANFLLKADVGDFCKDSLLVYKGRGVKMDTILVKKGKFTYSTALDKPSRYFLMTPESFRTHVWRALNILCVPGEKAVLTSEEKNEYNLTGSKYYQQFHEMDQMQAEASKELRDYDRLMAEKLYTKGSDREAVKKEYEEKSGILKKARNDKYFAFVAQHPDYECCVEMIDELEDVKDMEKLISLLSESVKNGKMKAYYQPFLESAKKRVEMEEKAKKAQASGVEAPDFTLKDINGKDLSLSSLRGKYVVLDFWGSWCIWCIKGMPKMKEYYEKYKGKFEILGVDCNDTEAKWKAAIEKHQLPWLHVYNPKSSDVLGKYAIQGFPTKIVIGPDGKIVKTIVGEDPAFYTLLDEILK